ncbi:hypothetical protein ACFLU6_01960 [Acidobacteriota bacterium]
MEQIELLQQEDNAASHRADRSGEHPFVDLGHYRAKIAKIIEEDKVRFINNQKADISGLTPGKWALSVLTRDPGLNRSLIDLSDLVADSMALWMKVRNDLDYSIRIGGSTGRVPEYIQEVLKENLDHGFTLMPKLQDVVDASIKDNNLPTAKEISKFKLNIYVNSLEIRELLQKGESLRISEEGKHHDYEDISSEDLAEMERIALEESQREDTWLAEGDKKKVGPQLEAMKNSTAARRHSALTQKASSLRPVKTSKTSGRFWLALLLCALVIPVVAILSSDAPTIEPVKGNLIFMPDDVSRSVNLAKANAKGAGFYCQVTEEWYGLTQEEKHEILNSLREILKKHGYTTGLLTGTDKKIQAQWAPDELFVLDPPAVNK